VAVNAVLKSKANGDKKFTWNDYTNILFGLKDGSIFDTSISGIFKILTHNVEHGYFLDTTPLKTTIQSLTSKMGFNKFGDLFIPTIISIVDKDTGFTLRIKSDDPRYSNLSLVDIMMASSAIPIAFPPQLVSGLSNGYLIDGATGQDEIPVYGLLHSNLSQPIDKLYIIARQFYYGPDVPFVLKPIQIVVNSIEALEYLRQSLYLSGLEEARSIKIPTFEYIPELPHHYGMFSFDQQKPQWEESMAWAKLHDPTRVN